MISFGNLPQRSVAWTQLKALVVSKKMQVQYEEDAATYFVYAYDGPEVIYCTIWKGEVPPPALAGYSQAQNDTDKTDFETSFKSAANQSIEPKNVAGYHLVGNWPVEGSRATLTSHDWTDPTSWYTRAVRVVDEVAAADVAFLVYSLAHENIIDTYHGKMSQEDFLKDSSGNSFRVVVKVDGVQKTERDPHVGSGGDYVIDYDLGKITFAVALLGANVVTVTYHYATTSEWVLKPATGKVLKITRAEVQFSADVGLSDSVVFQAYGLVDVFAPQLMPGVPSGTLIPLGDPVVYKGMRDYLNDANGMYPEIAAIGGAGWRGLLQPVMCFPWHYQSVTDLISTYGMEIRVRLQHDAPFIGTYATATFYCLSVAA